MLITVSISSFFHSYSCQCSITKRTSLPKNHYGANNNEFIPDILKYNNNLKHASVSLHPLSTFDETDETEFVYKSSMEQPSDKEEARPREESQPRDPSISGGDLVAEQDSEASVPLSESPVYSTYLAPSAASTLSRIKDDHGSLKDVQFNTSRDHVDSNLSQEADLGGDRLPRSVEGTMVVRWTEGTADDEDQPRDSNQIYATSLPRSTNSRPISEASSNESLHNELSLMAYSSNKTPVVQTGSRSIQGASSEQQINIARDVRGEITSRLLNVVQSDATITSPETITIDFPDQHGNHGNLHHHGNAPDTARDGRDVQHTYMSQIDMPKQLAHGMNVFAYDNAVMHDSRDNELESRHYVNLNRR